MGLTLVLLVLASAPAAQGWGGRVALVRKYRPGQTIVYATEIRSRAQVDSDPPGLKPNVYSLTLLRISRSSAAHMTKCYRMRPKHMRT